MIGFNADGKIAFRRQIKRLALADTFRKLPPCIVGIEVCPSAHFVGRTLRRLGIIPAISVLVGSKTTLLWDSATISECYARLG